MHYRLFFFLMLFVVAGCSKKESEGKEVPADPAESRGSKDTAPGKKPKLSIAADNIGPLSAQTKADLATLKKLLPGYRIEKGSESAEGTEYSVFKVFEGSELLLTIEPGVDASQTASIRISSGQVTTAEGLGVGTSFSDLAAKHPKLKCNGGADHHGMDILCHVGNLMFVFPVDTDQHYAKPVSLAKARRMLAEKKVRKLIWFPQND